MNRCNLIIFPLILFLSLSACKNNNRFRVDAGSEGLKVKIYRFDSAFIAFDSSNPLASTQELYGQYPQFMGVFVSDVLREDPTDSVKVSQAIAQFLSDTIFANVNKKVSETFKDVSAIESNISESYQRIHFFFPQIKLPQLYFFVSGFNQSMVVHPDFIGIGLDMYLGSDFPIYKEIAYDYLTYNMRPESIPVDIISAILFNNFKIDISEDRLLDNMLYRGKIMYILAVIMPQVEPNDLMGYTKFQWEWSRKYEQEIWNKMLDKSDIYSTDNLLIRKYLNEAPFTTPISQESPGRLGTWIAWQIVNSYMEKNKEITLVDLLKDNNYQKMLDNSGYKP